MTAGTGATVTAGIRPTTAKRVVRAAVVKVFDHRRVDRGMTLIEFESRCVRAGEIHELVTTDHAGLRPGDRVDRVGFVAFVEVGVAGVIERGDPVVVGGRPVGTVVGFDDCHFPNHYNVIVEAGALVTGADLDLAVEAEVTVGGDPAPEPGSGPS